jgi:hypothetical protein
MYFPDFWKWLFTIGFLISIGFLILSLFKTIASLSEGSISLSAATFPSLISFLSVVYIFAFYPFWVVSNYEIYCYIKSFFTADYEMYLRRKATEEGFLLENPTDPTMRDAVITKRILIQKLRGHLLRTVLPSGLYCEPGSAGKGPSKLMIEEYLKRLSLQDMSIKNSLTNKVFYQWRNTTHRVFSLLCRERSLIDKLVSRLEVDTVLDYSFNDLRDKLTPILMFYERSRVGNDRFRSRKDVNDILGLPIGERDPRNETALVGTNAFTLRTSSYDTGDVPSRPSDLSDPRMYGGPGSSFGMPPQILGRQAIISPSALSALPTQTNELNVLEWISNRAIPRINVATRGGNDER